MNAHKLSDVYFEFDSEEIGAQKWHYFNKSFTNETALKIVRAMDMGAKRVGDNPYCSWICETAVPIALAKPTGIMFPNREASNDLFYDLSISNNERVA